MKYLIAAAAILSLAACSPLTVISPGNAGNPNNQPFAGSPGSVYDQAANPPSIPGAVAYNPDAPVPPPQGLEMPAATPPR